tara:strand:- start:3770 stop:4990 length:1221 start_codon:yes stop_codon:yes gene_type:complete
MPSIRLGVIFDQLIKSGGGYQQALSSAILTKQIPKELADVVFFTLFKENISILSEFGIKAEIINLSFFEKLRNKFRAKIKNRYFYSFIKKFEKYSPFENQLIKHNIDLVYFLSPISLQQSLDRLNYITTLWDLCHRDELEFPEVRENREFERRDEFYKDILPRAVAVLVDSELSKFNTSNFYSISLNRVHVMPFQMKKIIQHRNGLSIKTKIDICKKFSVNKYIFYPAQFWAHKNHVYILDSLSLLEKKYGLKISVIFSGTDKGNQKYIESYARKLKIDDRVIYVGFVSDEEIIEFYRQSLALVMPTYFGPTNLPPLEAFELGTPVLYPDKEGLKDQVGDAALLMNLKDPNSMALHIKNLNENDLLRNKLIMSGYKKIEEINSHSNIEILKNIIHEFNHKRLCWKK